ncbi:tubulin monoglycylase TTLL3 isoform X1 [Esox lucius]|uniref:Tubulin tyrosine ligase-like family, member 3 n=1 Tax=Esox lucius TaxID=8010 RepID=A0A3P9AED1_ESOLU|nr:tubulin monoglycylase TTLL3 isoform X1 [Esox lucius]XP_010879583.2 tubulin monoglycylase TTLL3 isoform X1 [Esox lucius]XP_010879584.2 tubulin monoglycylase TTLL3 isoform X1 [Esox lucius]
MQHMPLPPVEGRGRRNVYNLPVINPNRLKTAKALVEKAVKLRRVFSVQGPYPVIRAALWARGWVERRLPCHAPQPSGRFRGDEEEDGEDRDDSNDDNDRLDELEREHEPEDMYDLMSRLVRNETTYFYWTTRRDEIDCRSLRKDQMTNHYAKSATFTTKVGLCVNLRNLQWFDAADPDAFFPRCYRLGAEDEKQAFIEDFRRTACTSLLQYIVERSDRDTDIMEENVSSQSAGPRKCRATRLIGPGIIDRALHICQELLNSLDHSDIDVTMDTPPTLTEQQWDSFVRDYYLVIHEGVVIEGSSEYIKRCQAMLTRLREVCPQLDTDGVHNIWIIKPGAKSRGRGIMCMNRLEEILRLVDSDPSLIKDSKWVVQKYLERPLLVHGTKFDLRQWFLVTDWNPLTVWFYQECYLRFSSQPYSTQTLDSSVHLCNNSIQKHFQPSQRRHPEVPEDNMWSCSQFQGYLHSQGQGAAWGALVVPGMQRAVVNALQTAQDLVEGRRGSFELYGADFMLGQDLRPWLLEINASPTMAPSTAVTARLCPAVQLDTLRVVLDRRVDPGADTGGFQLIYKQAAVEVPQYVGVNLLVEGAPLRRPRVATNRALDMPVTTHIHTNPSAPEAEDKPSSCRPSPSRRSLAKLNKSRRGKNRQSPTQSPKRVEEEGVLVHKSTPLAVRSSRRLAPERTLALHCEPMKRVCCFRLRSLRSAGPLRQAPRALSHSLSTPCGTLGGDFKPSHPTPDSQPFPGLLTALPPLPQSSLGAPLRALPRGLPTHYGSIPALEVIGLRPSPLTGLHIYQYLPHFHRQAMGTYKGGCASRGPKSS